MRYFYDTEFFEDGPGKPIIPISLGVVSEDGRELYVEYAISPFEKLEREWLEGLPQWHRDNILPTLVHYNRRCDCAIAGGTSTIPGPTCPLTDHQGAREAILRFVGDDKPEFWGYYADYDHVVLCQTFGRMIDLPKGWPMYTRDLKQWADSLNWKREWSPPQPKDEHNALTDARWNAELYRSLDRWVSDTRRER